MNRHRLQVPFLLLLLLLANWIIPGSSAMTAWASGLHTVTAASGIATISPAFSYQGTLRLADGSLATGSYNITLKLYNVVTGGSALYSESFSNVVVRNGNFSVVVGDAQAIDPALFDNASLYIGLTVAPDPEMLPRQRLFPVPWAMQAMSAQNAVNATSATNAQTANTLIANATIPGLLTIDRGNGGVSNNQWPALLLTSNGDGYGSALYFRNVNGNQNWSIYPDPSGELHIEDRNNGVTHVVINQNGTTTVKNLGVVGNLTVNGTMSAGSLATNGDISAGGKVTAAQGFNGKCVQGAFNAGVVGNNLNVTCNQDVAETFATDQRTEPGDLVVFVPEDRTLTTVQPSATPYATMIVGVVSTNPGLVFDQGQTYLAGDNANLITAEQTVVAMVGRVPTKFSLENGPIAVGDPLTSSSTPGVAMKATQAGQIIGYAMQSSDAAEDGKLLVWLQIGTYVPPTTLAALNAATDTAATLADLQAQIAALSAQVAQLEAQTPQTQAVGR